MASTDTVFQALIVQGPSLMDIMLSHYSNRDGETHEVVLALSGASEDSRLQKVRFQVVGSLRKSALVFDITGTVDPEFGKIPGWGRIGPLLAVIDRYTVDTRQGLITIHRDPFLRTEFQMVQVWNR